MMQKSHDSFLMQKTFRTSKFKLQTSRRENPKTLNPKTTHLYLWTIYQLSQSDSDHYQTREKWYWQVRSEKPPNHFTYKPLA